MTLKNHVFVKMVNLFERDLFPPSLDHPASCTLSLLLFLVTVTQGDTYGEHRPGKGDTGSAEVAAAKRDILLG